MHTDTESHPPESAGTAPDVTDHDERLLADNAAWAQAFDDADAAKRPTRELFVLTCMDARVDPLRLLGLSSGDAHVVRNAGGRVSDDVARSLVLSSALLGTTHAVVIHHTDCGLGPTTADAMRADLADAGVDVGNLWLGTFEDLDEGVREDVDRLGGVRTSHDVSVSGFVYDVATGRLHPVASA